MEAFNSIAINGLSSRVYGDLIGMLTLGQLRAGSIIHERSLATTLGVSRTPLRDALGRLEHDGLVVREGRHLIVCPVTIADYAQVFAARRLVECETATLAAGHIDAATLGDIRQRLLDLRSVSRDDLRDAKFSITYNALDDEVHVAIAKASRNHYLVEMVVLLRRRLLLFDVGRIPDRLASDVDEHLAILEAIGANDARRARSAMRLHLKNTQQNTLKVIESL